MAHTVSRRERHHAVAPPPVLLLLGSALWLRAVLVMAAATAPIIASARRCQSRIVADSDKLEPGMLRDLSKLRAVVHPISRIKYYPAFRMDG
jgi:hypothetical protein